MSLHARALIAAALLAATACTGSTKTDAASRDTASPTVVATALASSTGCDSAGVGEVRRAIEAAYARANEGLRRGDVEPLWSLYADDAIYMWDDQRMWRGKAEARQEAPKALGGLSFTNIGETIDDLMVCGSLAVVAGHFDIRMRQPSGAEVKVTGKNLVVWRRDAGGAWRIVRNLGNNDAPATR